MLVDLAEHSGHGVGTPIVGIVCGRWREVALPARVLPIHAEEWQHPGCLGSLVVGGELCEWQPVCPIVLEVSHVGAEVLFHDGIHSLGLAIGFRVEGGAKSPIDAEPVPEPLSEGCCNLWVTVGNYAVWQALEAEDMLDEHVRQIGCIYNGTAGNEVACLGKPVDHHPDGVVAA